MPLDLRTLVAPEHTAVLTMEMQRGVIGDFASMGALREVIDEQGTLESVRRLLAGARDAGAHVVHNNIEQRADGRGTARNCRMLAAGAANETLTVGHAGTEVVAEIGPADSDLVVSRIHGMTPFNGTSLDQILRNMGVTTVVATGVSLNIGVLGMIISAVDAGYQVVVPTDAVAGVPAEYGEQVLANTIYYLATLTKVDDVLAAWA